MHAVLYEHVQQRLCGKLLIQYLWDIIQSEVPFQAAFAQCRSIEEKLWATDTTPHLHLLRLRCLEGAQKRQGSKTCHQDGKHDRNLEDAVQGGCKDQRQSHKEGLPQDNAVPEPVLRSACTNAALASCCCNHQETFTRRGCEGVV